MEVEARKLRWLRGCRCISIASTVAEWLQQNKRSSAITLM